ncbi:MAG: SMP-30/gluconolactonase/LRE family protein [Gemmatimonadaceae bacterium]|nr:SMP-30/gluconolactonase/LRE family protein [Gemmatimonadaceae bacterium]
MRPSLASLGLCLSSLAAAGCTHSPAPRVMAVGSIERLDPALDALVPRDARVERLAGGFSWAEGPAWRKNGGYLVFSDAPHNTMWRWKEGEGLSVFLRPAGYTGQNPPGREIGSNGITIDANGAVVYADHGNRLVTRLVDSNFTKVILAERYQGKRFNSPNDLVFRSNGDLYFTDPPYGLAGQDSDPAKELPFNGVYRVTPGGEVTLLTKELTRPNGIAFSPDERTLYVANSDPAHAVWMAYDVAADGTIGNGRVLFDATPLAKQGKPGLPDGMRVDRAGNLFAAGPGGILVLTPQGKHLGTIVTGQPTANCAWGDDGSTLYMTANDQLFRIRLTTTGARF